MKPLHVRIRINGIVIDECILADQIRQALGRPGMSADRLDIEVASQHGTQIWVYTCSAGDGAGHYCDKFPGHDDEWHHATNRRGEGIVW